MRWFQFGIRDWLWMCVVVGLLCTNLTTALTEWKMVRKRDKEIMDLMGELSRERAANSYRTNIYSRYRTITMPNAASGQSYFLFDTKDKLQESKE